MLFLLWIFKLSFFFLQLWYYMYSSQILILSWCFMNAMYDPIFKGVFYIKNIINVGLFWSDGCFVCAHHVCFVNDVMLLMYKPKQVLHVMMHSHTHCSHTYLHTMLPRDASISAQCYINSQSILMILCFDELFLCLIDLNFGPFIVR
jgi:hypothetical protein